MWSARTLGVAGKDGVRERREGGKGGGIAALALKKSDKGGRLEGARTLWVRFPGDRVPVLACKDKWLFVGVGLSKHGVV